MSIESRLNDDMKQAMRAKQADRLACIRQVKAKIQEAVNAPGFAGPTDDALYQKVIAAYVKSLQKAFPDLEAAGERGAGLRAKYAAEIAYLEPFLPQRLDEAATRALVQAAVADLGITDPKQAGRVMGAIMKEHKDEVDAALVRQLVDEALGPKA